MALTSVADPWRFGTDPEIDMYPTHAIFDAPLPSTINTDYFLSTSKKDSAY